MRYKGKVLAAVAVLLFFTGGCGKAQDIVSKKLGLSKSSKTKTSLSVSVPVTGTVIAEVNNMPITLEELDKEIENYNSLVPEDKPKLKIKSREDRINYLKNEMIKRMLLYQEALDRGLDKKRDVAEALERIKRNLLVTELIKEEADKVNVTSKEIEDYYNRFKEQLKEPEERRIREIVVLSEAEAKDILIRLLQGEDFATLAREKSIAASAKKGGDLGFIKPGQHSKTFDEVAFSDTLEVGDISHIFKGHDGYYILKLEAKRGGKQKSLSDMWDNIKRALTFLKQQKRINDLIGRLSSQAKIEVFEDKVK